MVPPLLKLAFVQGPRDGESLEYKPGSTIRIGRIVRGNEIVVKDAGVSTKHLRIVSDSENWIVHDLGSSNGTILNSEPLDSDTPVILRHGDVIKLGECTSIVVNFETDAQVEEEEHKLPPRPRRNNRRLRRVGRPRKNEKKVAVMKEEEEAVPVEKKGNSKAKSFDLNPIKLEIEDTRIGVEISEMKRGTRSSRQMRNECLGLEENVKCEDTVIEEKRRPSRATRSKKEAIGGDSFLELEMVLNQAKKSRAKKKKTEQKSVVEEMESRNEDVEEDEKGRIETCDKVDEASKMLEQVEIESRKSTLGEDGEAENLQDEVEEEGDCKSNEAVIETSDGGCEEEGKAEQGSRNDKNVEKVDLEKMTLGDWFEYMKVHLRKQIVDKTEMMIEDMRSKSLRVRHHIAEQKQAKEEGSVN
ncbi:unnamed protein product [Brassica rapa]|uniref:FHA domain-containing protein n=1 Tax=Brassica campestris TaxID=3711 RepID=A0A3P5ZMZ5_BRACM|nr:FHA domain-containing protein At4g14490 [Brassica napus]CAG7878558.1 unnamed protein product [Brassica rapa]VDC73428.1 unnamed protein product [Brassica rapa]